MFHPALRTVVWGVFALLFLPGLAAEGREVSGKVVAVYHEPVTVNAKVLDKVSVTVDASCASPSRYETVSYAPGAVSEDNHLGFLFRDLAVAARGMVQKNQFMNSVSGHVTLQVNEQNTVQKTTFWGYNWECGRNIDNSPATPGMQAPQGYQAPQQQTPPPAGNPAGNMLRRFGGF